MEISGTDASSQKELVRFGNNGRIKLVNIVTCMIWCDYTEAMNVGQNLTDHHRNKSVVSGILSEDQVPEPRDGNEHHKSEWGHNFGQLNRHVESACENTIDNLNKGCWFRSQVSPNSLFINSFGFNNLLF